MPSPVRRPLRAIVRIFFQSSSSTRRMSSSSGSAAILLMMSSTFFELQVDDVVHHTHRLLDVLLEFLEVERRFFGERFVHVTQQVDRQQAARVVGAKRNFAAGVGRHGRKSFVGIAVGNTFTDDRVPEHYARFGRFPGVVDDLVPKFLGVDILLVERFVRVNRELLVVFLPGECRTHEFVVDFD